MSDVQTRIGITPVVRGGSGARSELAALWNEFKNGKMSVDEFNQAMRNTSGAIYAQRRAVMLMRTEYRNQRAALYEAMRGFRAVARIGRTITDTYMTYTLMQLRVADRTRDVRDTQEDLAKVQVRRQRVVADLGATNAISLRLINEEERLTKRLTEEKRDLKRAQDQNIIGYTGMILRAVDVIPTLVSLNRHIDLTSLLLSKPWTYTGLKGIVTAASAAEVSILGVQASLGSLALAVGAPIVATVIVKTAMETPYWLGDTEKYPIPPSGGGTPGFDMWGWLTDLFSGGDGDGLGDGVQGGLGTNLGPDWGRTLEGLEGDLPVGSPLRDLYTGGGADVTVEGEDVEVDVKVDVTVTPRARHAGEGNLR